MYIIVVIMLYALLASLLIVLLSKTQSTSSVAESRLRSVLSSDRTALRCSTLRDRVWDDADRNRRDLFMYRFNESICRKNRNDALHSVINSMATRMRNRSMMRKVIVAKVAVKVGNTLTDILMGDGPSNTVFLRLRAKSTQKKEDDELWIVA